MPNTVMPSGAATATQQYASNLIAALRGNTARAGVPMASNPGFTEFAYRGPQSTARLPANPFRPIMSRPMSGNAQAPMILSMPAATVDQIDAWRAKNGFKTIRPPAPEPEPVAEVAPPSYDSSWITSW